MTLSRMMGGKYTPNELTELDNNMVDAKKSPKGRNGEEDVSMSLALLQEIIGVSVESKEEIMRTQKLIAEEESLTVKEAVKIRELYRILGVILEAERMEELRIRQEV